MFSLSRPFASLADVWIGRRAMPQPEALAAVSGLSPAVVITGASRGIGQALASRFGRAGRNVVLIAREERTLDAATKDIAQSTGVRAVAMPLDVTLSDVPQRLDAALKDAGLYADVLVNNAGVGLAGAFADHSQDALDALITLNITAATRLMRHALPPMVARGRGGVLNVGSLGALVPGPYQAAYYASKAYLVSLTEAAAFEARGRGVRISVVAPGPVDTTFHQTMRAENALYRTIIPALSAEAVANSAYRGFMLGRTVIVPGVLPTLASVAVKLLPHAVTVPLVGALLGVGERTPPSDRV